MRDPKRIDRILKKVYRLWNLMPDQRLGQLLGNFVFGFKVHGDGRLYIQEDDMTEELLDKLLEEMEK